MLTLTLTLTTATACSSSGSSASPPTTAPCAAPPISPSAAPPNHVVPVEGSGARDVGLPGELSLPLIVHTHASGSGSFVVRGLDASGKETEVLATALGAYDGTFAVGFIDPCASPTIALRVASTGAWHLDFADASLAPRYTSGIAGKGDSVLSYVGKAATARVTYSGTTPFVIATYGAAGPKVLARSPGAFRGTVKLPTGPVFITVTAGTAAWSLAPA